MSTAAILDRPTRPQRATHLRDESARDSVAFAWATELTVGPGVPPKPLPAILVALQQIPAGAPQYVRLSCRAPDLVAALRQRGMTVTEEALPDGRWRMTVSAPAR